MPISGTPYQSAVEGCNIPCIFFSQQIAAQQLDKLKTPWSKVQCLIDTGKEINQCVQKFWGAKLPPEKLEM